MRNLPTLIAAAATVAAAVLFGQPSPTLAQQSAPAGDAQQAATELVALLTGDAVPQMTNALVANSWPTMEALLKQQNPGMDQATVAELQQEFAALAQAEVAEILKGAPAIYARNFTADELRDIIAFYKTPTGAKTLKIMPQTTAQLSVLVAAAMKDVPAKLNAAFAEIVKKHTQPANANTVPLLLYWSAQRGDNFTAVTAAGQHDAQAAGYALVRTEGYVFAQQAAGTVPLLLYRSANGSDNFTTATAEGQRDAQASGYSLVRTEGYVYAQQAAGTVPLLLYWSAQRHDNFTTATAQGAADAKGAGYVLVRTEGYVFPAK